MFSSKIILSRTLVTIMPNDIIQKIPPSKDCVCRCLQVMTCGREAVQMNTAHVLRTLRTPSRRTAVKQGVSSHPV